MNWSTFLDDSPSRVVDLIEGGPIPMAEYPTSKLRQTDQKRGVMRFKGGTGRGGIPVKSGQECVVYFDGDFRIGVYQEPDVPDEVQDRHTRQAVTEAFKKL